MTKIKLFITDLDGCLTDGTYQEGTPILRTFHTRDFLGLRLLHQGGVEVMVLTSSSVFPDAQFYRTCPWATIHYGVKDKKMFIETLIAEGKLKTSLPEIAYIGDDINDLELLKIVGIAACPEDAEEEVRTYVSNRPVGRVMRNKGGRGAVREFANFVCRVSNIKTDWIV